MMKLQKNIRLSKLTDANALHTLCIISLKVTSGNRSGLLNLLSKFPIRVPFSKDAVRMNATTATFLVKP